MLKNAIEAAAAVLTLLAARPSLLKHFKHESSRLLALAMCLVAALFSVAILAVASALPRIQGQLLEAIVKLIR